MVRGGRQKRGNVRFFPSVAFPNVNPNPSSLVGGGWIRPSDPSGFRGFPETDLNLRQDPMSRRPIMNQRYAPVTHDVRPSERVLGLRVEPSYGNINDAEFMYGGSGEEMHEIPNLRGFDQSVGEQDFVSVDQEYRQPAKRGFAQMDGSMPSMESLPRMHRDIGGICEFDYMDRECIPQMAERGIGSTMPMDRFFGSVNNREAGTSSTTCQETQGEMCRGTQRRFQRWPNGHFEGMGHRAGTETPMMDQAEWDMGMSGPQHCSQINTRMPAWPRPRSRHPQKKWNKFPAPKKPRLTPSIANAKLPPGRFKGVISFISGDLSHGLIEKDDLKKFPFSSQAFWGDSAHLIPGVKVHFTVYNKKGERSATDVVVPPGGTEEVDTRSFVGVVSRSLSDKQKFPRHQSEGKSSKGPLSPYPGCITTTVFGKEMELSFTEGDSKVTLLLRDHVKFHLLTDLVTKEKRATGISVLPDTFQFTKETREMGIVLNLKDGRGSIVLENGGDICFDSKENLGDSELNITDEVEFTLLPAEGPGKQKAIRVKKLPEGSVTFKTKAKEMAADEPEEQDSGRSCLGQWEAGSSETLPQRTVVFEDVSSELYEGTVSRAVSKVSDKKLADSGPNPYPGLLVTTLAGAEKELAFGSGDVLSEATIVPGDKVQFNISINRGTKAERAINVEILPDTFRHSQEQREKGIVVDLRESFGYIKCQQYPQLLFRLGEVMEESKLDLSDEVEFTVHTNTSAMEGVEAVRIRRLPFIPTPKLKGFEAAGKDQKKITIKLQKDSVKDEMKNVKVKIESSNTEDCPQNQVESPDPEEEPNSCKPGELGWQLSTSEGAPPLEAVAHENDAETVLDLEKTCDPKGSSGTSLSKENKEMGEGTECTVGSGQHHGRDGRYWRPVGKVDCEHGRSRSREQGDRPRRSLSPSQSHSQGHRQELRYELSDRQSFGHGRGCNRSRSRSRERRDTRPRSRERPAGSTTKRSLERETSSRKINSVVKVVSQPFNQDRFTRPQVRTDCSPVTQDMARSENILDEELARKKRELELLEEQIARRRAIIAMEQKGLGPKAQQKEETDSESPPYTDNGYDRSRPPLKFENHTTAACVPVKSILKKCTEPFVVPDTQQSEFTEALPPKQISVHLSRFEQPPMYYSPHTQTTDEECNFVQPSDQQSTLTQTSKQFYPEKSHVIPSSINQPAHDKTPYRPLGHSSVHPTTLDLPFVCHSHTSQQSQAAPKDKSNLSTQIERFLNTLNKGVDANLLSSLVREAREATAAYEKQQGCLPCGDDDQREDPYWGGPGEPELCAESSQVTLLPHQRAMQSDGAFSCINGARHEPQVHEEPWGERGMEDEERISYGAPTDDSQFECSMAPNKGYSPSPPAEEMADKMHHFDKIQSLLQTIGLDLDTAEVSRLADRTRERLYGKKQTVKPQRPQTESPKVTPDKEPEGMADKADHLRSQAVSSKSEEPCCNIPIRSSNREVYMNYKDLLEHSHTADPERPWEMTQESLTVPQTLQHTHEAVAPPVSAPSTSQYVQSQQSSRTSVYSTVQHVGYERFQPSESAYSQSRRVVPSTWDHVAPPSEMQSHPAYLQHPESPYSLTPPMGPASQYLGVSVDPQALPSFSPTAALSHIPVTLSMGHPLGVLSGFVGNSPVPFPSPGTQPAPVTASQYPLYPLAGLPAAPNMSTGSSAFVISQPLSVDKGGQTKFTATTKSRCLRVIKTVEMHEQTLTNKEVPAALKEVTSDTGSGFSALAPPPASSAPMEKKPMTKISEDDIKAKQKKRLEQFNERMRQKKEQRREAQRTDGESQTPPAGKACKGVKNVWICGHSLVIWAEKRARSPACGMQLGLDPNSVHLWWKGTEGMMWEQLLPMLWQLKSTWPDPDVIIMHLGGNNLGGKFELESFLAMVKKDLTSMKRIFPQCLLVWSNILPRRSWRAAEDSTGGDWATLNKRVDEDIRKLGGATLTHDHIRPGSDAGLYRPDGDHLSGKGIDLFNINMQNFLKTWESNMNKATKSS